MSKKHDIEQAAERVFYRRGFHGVGVDTVIDEAGVSPRTLYKHFASKDELAAAVLKARGQRYVALLDQCTATPGSGDVSPLFEAVGKWLRADAAHGCMFFNALGEYKSRNPEIEAVIREHKTQVRRSVSRYLHLALNRGPDRLTDQVVLLIEGATAQSTISSTDTAIAAARAAAQRLVDATRQERS